MRIERQRVRKGMVYLRGTGLSGQLRVCRVEISTHEVQRSEKRLRVHDQIKDVVSRPRCEHLRRSDEPAGQLGFRHRLDYRSVSVDIGCVKTIYDHDRIDIARLSFLATGAAPLKTNEEKSASEGLFQLLDELAHP